MSLSVASWNLALDAALDVLGGGFIDVYAGARPATPNVPVAGQVKLAHLPLSATAFASAAGGTKIANPIVSATGLAAGTATWFRAYKSDDTTGVVDGSVGTSGADFIINDADIAPGGVVQVVAWSVSMPLGQ